ncbi:hypothetical protein [Nocardia terpenica]|uniref:hypothetical protein n=1 Tax=Nocardia terpenica TaxID=455432 RepID=UPI000B1CD0EC|nr:hypothetical protein [Nocardia terpenica]NQE89319.1 hypothetical protein [Nocardia terpenica]
MALGQVAAADLWQAASEGNFRLEEGAAHELAGHYQWFADEMVKRQQEIQLQQRLQGFGSLESAKRLQSGFEQKAIQAYNALIDAEASALRMKAAILRAANLTDEVEAANTAVINAINGKFSDGKA